MKNFDDHDPAWDKTRALLREHLQSPPLAHPDFVNSRVMEAIGRMEKPKPQAPPGLLRRLIWAGAGALAAAVVLTLVLLPGQMGPRGAGEFMTQVVEARAATPGLSVSSFQAPGDRAAVLWIEGASYIPADQAVR